MARAALAFAVVVGAAHAAPLACPIDAAALARLQAEHAAMNAGGLACLRALDAARAERDRVALAAAEALDDLARELAASAEALDAAQAALAAPVVAPPAPPGRRPWVLVALGGVVAAGATSAAAALDAGPVEAAGIGLGAAALTAGVVAVVTWATGE